MHIADGIIPNAWCGAAHAAAWAGVYGFGRKVEPSEIVRMGLLASAMFAVSLVHFPIGGTSVHLGLYGLAGILLGTRAIPVIFAALLFQTLLFQHGGLLSLGLNAVNMGAGALTAAILWRLPVLKPATVPKAFLCGFAGIAIPATPDGVETILRRGDAADYLVAINHGTDEVSLTTSGTDLLTQAEIRDTLVLPGGDVAVVRVAHTAPRGDR